MTSTTSLLFTLNTERQIPFVIEKKLDFDAVKKQLQDEDSIYEVLFDQLLKKIAIKKMGNNINLIIRSSEFEIELNGKKITGPKNILLSPGQKVDLASDFTLEVLEQSEAVKENNTDSKIIISTDSSEGLEIQIPQEEIQQGLIESLPQEQEEVISETEAPEANVDVDEMDFEIEILNDDEEASIDSKDDESPTDSEDKTEEIQAETSIDDEKEREEQENEELNDEFQFELPDEEEIQVSEPEGHPDEEEEFEFIEKSDDETIEQTLSTSLPNIETQALDSAKPVSKLSFFTKLFKRKGKQVEKQEVPLEEDLEEAPEEPLKEKTSLLNKVKRLFKKKRPEIPEESFDENTDISSVEDSDEELDEIEKSLTKSTGAAQVTQEEINELQKQKAQVPLKEARKFGSSDKPAPKIVMRTFSLFCDLIFVFSFYVFIKKSMALNEAIGSFLTQTSEKVFKSLYSLIPNFLEKFKVIIGPSPEIQEILNKLQNHEQFTKLLEVELSMAIQNLAQSPVRAILEIAILYFLVQLLCAILFGAPLTMAISGIKENSSFIISRFKALLRMPISALSLLFPVFELPILIGKRPFREVVTGSQLYYSSLSWSNFMTKFLIPLVLFLLYSYPIFLSLNNLGSFEFKNDSFKKGPIEKLEYSNMFQVSWDLYNSPSVVNLPRWDKSDEGLFKSSLIFLSTKNHQKVIFETRKSINIKEIIERGMKKNPVNEIMAQPTQESPDQNDLSLLMDSLALSIDPNESWLKVMKKDPFLIDDLTIRESFLKSIGISKFRALTIHTEYQGKDQSDSREVVIEILSGLKTLIETRDYIVIKNGIGKHYRLTYHRKENSLFRILRKSIIEQFHFFYKAPQSTRKNFHNILVGLNKLTSGALNQREAKRQALKVFDFYYFLSKRSLRSNQKKFIKYIRNEVVNASNLISTNIKEPKDSQQIRDKFKTLAKALDKLDTRYFSR
ncbi:MAG: hypothetical protein ACPGJV_04500 [Bacteriovoracaceae bacterium]